MRGISEWLLALALVFSVVACDAAPVPPQMPLPEAVETAYGAVEAEVSGNLLRVRVPMPEGFERGGSLWARSGPYFYLFSPASRDLFAQYEDMAAIEVVTTTGKEEEVARARLLRNTLNAVTWDEAIAYAAQAQTEGTERPSLVDRLVRFAEDRTEFEYNPDFVPR